MDSSNRIIAIVNLYSKISFNFGPTLLSWLEKHEPDVYKAIIDADQRSKKRFSGHGSAIAQVYNHMIMPLSNQRDKRTQVIWGIEDFRRRFNRMPEGMWLAETAVDNATLEALAEQGIKFTILAPHQAARMRRKGEQEWTEVSGGKIDPKRAYVCRLPSGKSISIFFYDWPVSHDVAFSTILDNGKDFAKRLTKSFTNEGCPQLVNIATDGETYGHHHRFGDMALAYCLYYLESKNTAVITNYGEFLEKFPPEFEVQVFENTSWSCAHGVERWKGNCGCKMGKFASQAWRGPLREAMDWLRDVLAPLYESALSKYAMDPWDSRDNYIEVVLDRSEVSMDAFFERNAGRKLAIEERRRVLNLLECQRHAMLMYTSCGWFFDELSGIETVQIMKYAARVIQLIKDIFGVDLEKSFLEKLAAAKSNVPAYGDGARIYETMIKPSYVDLVKVGVHYAISSIFNRTEPGPSKVYCYSVNDEVYLSSRSGRQVLVTGRSRITSEITLDEQIISYAVLWLGDHNLFGGARVFVNEEAFKSMCENVTAPFKRGEIHRTIALIDDLFTKDQCTPCTLKNLFKDKQIAISKVISELALKKAISRYKEIYDDSLPVMLFLKEIGLALPNEMQAAAEVVLTNAIREALRLKEIDLELLTAIVEQAEHLDVDIDRMIISLDGQRRVEAELDAISRDPDDIPRIVQAAALLKLLFKLKLTLNLWYAQNEVFSIISQYYAFIEKRVKRGDESADRWLASFRELCMLMGVKV
jgi:alpha-amylase/alpha-mannosidase (GH57 family)